MPDVYERIINSPGISNTSDHYLGPDIIFGRYPVPPKSGDTMTIFFAMEKNLTEISEEHCDRITGVHHIVGFAAWSWVAERNPWVICHREWDSRVTPTNSAECTKG